MGLVNVLINQSGGGWGAGGWGAAYSHNWVLFPHTCIDFHKIWTQGYHGKDTHVT